MTLTDVTPVPAGQHQPASAVVAPSPAAVSGPGEGWTVVCPVEAIVPDTGVCALVDDAQVAVFRLGSGEIHAVGNHDPFSDAAVLSRGILGDRQGRPKVSSPVYKQSFDLESGVCLDEGSVRIPVYRARVADGMVLVSTTPG